MIVGRSSFRVDIRHSNGSYEPGEIATDRQHPKLVVSSSGNEAGRGDIFRLLEKGYSDHYLYPPLFTRFAPYSASSMTTQDMYPPSSEGWVTRMQQSGNHAQYAVFASAHDSDLLLFISDPHSAIIHEIVVIKAYEAPILKMMTDHNLYSEIQESVSLEMKHDPFAVLEGPSPRISAFEALIGKAAVTFTYQPNSLEATLDPLVPESFPEDVRMQIKAFYANVVLETIPDVDPLNFSASLLKYPLLRDLMLGHLRCVSDGVEPPSYVQMFNAAAEEVLGSGSVPFQGATEAPPWRKAWFKILEIFPSWFDRVRAYARKLAENETIPSRLPGLDHDEEESAADRLAFAVHGLLIRAQLREKVLGFRYLLYLGSAYRWPHRHTSWSLRFTRIDEQRPLYLQVMLMPPRALAQARNRIPSVVPVDWMLSRRSLDAFDEKKKSWRFPLNKIYDSLSKTRANRDFRRDFRIRARERVVKINSVEAKVLSQAYFQISLEMMERGVYSKLLGISNERIAEILEELRRKRVLTMQYNPSLFSIGKLFSLGIDLVGPSEKINSFMRTFLNRAPSVTAFVSDSHDYALLVSRVPRSVVPDIFGRLPQVAGEAGVKMRVWPVEAYSAYTHDIFSRLLREDGTWDDDVSGFTSQSRSTPSDD